MLLMTPPQIEAFKKFWEKPLDGFKRERHVFGLPGIRVRRPDGSEFYHWNKKFEEPPYDEANHR